jgi:hypothetical protein
MLAATGIGCGSEDSSSEGTDVGEQNTVARPTQFVILAFDGSLNNAFWEESRAFARDAGVKFTYFISGVYFIPDAKKSLYNAPHGQGPGKSAIGFGGEAAAVATRYGHLQKAANEGHEIASHANGHFDGSNWSEADWKSEFDQFDKIIFEGAGVPRPSLNFGPRDSVGFRAPQLGHSSGLWPVLRSHSYAYDTSKSGPSNYWPQENNGLWNFPLAELRIVGSNKRTLSMDYNFYVADSRGNADAANKAVYKKQMVDTYVKYFESNYFGNRGPIHIGHHFSKWNGGAYWEAMQSFARKVCGLPEVKCGTYKELLAFVKENKDKLPAYQAGNFTRMARPPSSEPVDVSATFTDEERAEALAAHETHDDESAE